MIALLLLLAGVGVVITSSSGSGEVHANRLAAKKAIKLSSITPGSGAKAISWSSNIVVRLNQSLSPRSELPTITPSIPGHWNRTSSNALIFRPTGFLLPGSVYTITVPGGVNGLRAMSGERLSQTIVSRFTTVGASLFRLQQLLAELRYLPFTFTPKGRRPTTGLAHEPNLASLVSFAPEQGSFAPRYPNTPSQLTSLFQPGVWTSLDQGAVMTFEADHGLPVDGILSTKLWGAVTAAVAARDLGPAKYNYLIATETLPERLEVWSNGAVVYSSLTNTGVPGATTPLGTWPVWLRYLSTTMSGTNPNGSKYDDPGIPNVGYFYNSDAVHGFIRSSYGYPQSDGCVELPLPAAQVVYGYDPIGTLVTITTGALPT